MFTIHQQPQPPQDLHRLACAGIVDAAPADGLLQRQSQLALVQPRGLPSLRRLVLPTLRRVHLLQQQALVGLARHRPRGVENPLIGDTAKGHRNPRRPCDAEHEYFATTPDAHSLQRREQRRLEILELAGQLFQGVVAHGLTDHLARRGDSKEQSPALAIREGAECAAGAVLLGSGFLELQPLGLAGGDPKPRSGRASSHGLGRGHRRVLESKLERVSQAVPSNTFRLGFGQERQESALSQFRF